MAKQHWTQTKKGRARMRAIQIARWARTKNVKAASLAKAKRKAPKKVPFAAAPPFIRALAVVGAKAELERLKTEIARLSAQRDAVVDLLPKLQKADRATDRRL